MLGKVYKFILLCLVLILSACGQIELVESPWGQTSTPFIYSVITPSEPVKVFLGQNIVTENSVVTTYYPDAKVFFCEEGKPWMELQRSGNDFCYFINNNMTLPSEKHIKLELSLATPRVRYWQKPQCQKIVQKY